MSYSTWLCIKRIIFFGTSQIFPCLNKVCEKTGKMFFFSHCVLPFLTYLNSLVSRIKNATNKPLQVLGGRPGFSRLQTIGTEISKLMTSTH